MVPLQWEELVESEGLDLRLVFNSMTKQIQNLLAQRDSFLEVSHLKAVVFPNGKNTLRRLCLILRSCSLPSVTETPGNGGGLEEFKRESNQDI